MKRDTIECRLIISHTASDKELFGGSEPKINWFELCDKAYGSIVDKTEFVRLVEKYEPTIPELGASIIEHGQMLPVEVRVTKVGKSKAYHLVSGRRRLLAILYNACRVNVPVPRIRAVEVA